jgi:Ca2+-binding RTX toxin-like protein
MNLFRREGRRKRLPVVAFAGVLFAFQAIALVGAQVASALVSCTYSGGVVTVTMGSGDAASFSTGAGDEIQETGTNCGAATLDNTTAINITGFSGDETVTIDTSVDWGTINWTINLGTGTGDALDLDGSAATDDLAVTLGASGADLNGDDDLDATLSGIEVFSIEGGAGDDTLSAGGGGTTGAAFADDVTISGDVGDDTLVSGAGDDDLDGVSGVDTVDYSAATAAVVVDLTAGTATGGGGFDTLANFDNLVGSAFNDTLTGSAGANDIIGGLGDDAIDCVDSNADDFADFSDSAAAVTVDLDAGTATGDGTDTIDNCTSVQGSDLGDTISGDDGANQLLGGAGNDSLAGMGGGDTLEGESGSDWVDYSWSDAVVLELNCKGVDGSEATNGDVIRTMENATLSPDDDSFIGNEFSNAVEPNGGQNSLEGDCAIPGSGGDSLDYSVGYDTGVTVNLAGGGTGGDAATDFENVIGTSFKDNITGNEESNTLKSRKGSDNVRGGSGDDTIKAGAGNDIVRGGTGDDDLWGQKGNDYLNGGGGDDFCKGGPGKDKVVHCEAGHK